MKPLAEAFGGFPPNREALDVARDFSISYSREGMAKVMAAVRACSNHSHSHSTWHRRSRDMVVSSPSAAPAASRSSRSSFASYRPRSGISSIVSSLFGAPAPLRNTGYVSAAPRIRAFGMGMAPA